MRAKGKKQTLYYVDSDGKTHSVVKKRSAELGITMSDYIKKAVMNESEGLSPLELSFLASTSPFSLRLKWLFGRV